MPVSLHIQPGCSAYLPVAVCPSLNGFLDGALISSKGPWGCASSAVCVASIVTLGLPSAFRPAVWDVPEASTLARYSNGGCPWCVHFIYDEYYMANLLLVLNSSWENVTRGGFGRCRAG